MDDQAKATTYTFTDDEGARTAPAPQGDSAYVEYKCEAVHGVFVRVMPPDVEGRVHRLWVYRHGQRKDVLGSVEPVGSSDEALSLADVQKKIQGLAAS